MRVVFSTVRAKNHIKGHFHSPSVSADGKGRGVVEQHSRAQPRACGNTFTSGPTVGRSHAKPYGLRGARHFVTLSRQHAVDTHWPSETHREKTVKTCPHGTRRGNGSHRPFSLTSAFCREHRRGDVTDLDSGANSRQTPVRTRALSPATPVRPSLHRKSRPQPDSHMTPPRSC